jgi:hypothetical protein
MIHMIQELFGQTLRAGSDGLVGMWGHLYDYTGEIILQGEFIGRTVDGYIVQVYSLEHGNPVDCKVVPRQKVLDNMKLYQSIYDMNEAMTEYRKQGARQEEMQRETVQRNLLVNCQPSPQAELH